MVLSCQCTFNWTLHPNSCVKTLALSPSKTVGMYTWSFWIRRKKKGNFQRMFWNMKCLQYWKNRGFGGIRYLKLKNRVHFHESLLRNSHVSIWNSALTLDRQKVFLSKYYSKWSASVKRNTFFFESAESEIKQVRKSVFYLCSWNVENSGAFFFFF